LSYNIFGMKIILLRVSIFFLKKISFCSKKSCKTLTSSISHDGVAKNELNWTAEYCNEELETIENSSPVTSYNINYTSVTEITCD